MRCRSSTASTPTSGGRTWTFRSGIGSSPNPAWCGIYHAVGNYDLRSDLANQVNIKTTHLIVPTVEKLKADGYPVELVFCTNIPNRDVRYYQLQSDIVIDMLTFGFFGATSAKR